MKDLLTTQHEFQDYILTGNDTIAHAIMSTENVPAHTRLAIYANAYRLRLIDALASNYPVLKTYLGDDAFTSIANEYIDYYPSTFRSIRWFGEHVPDFISQHADYSDYVFLTELAQFEWCLSLAFDAADSKVMHEHDISRLPPDVWINMSFTLHPSVHLLTLSTNAVKIWQDISEENTPVEPCDYPEKITWLIWRNQLLNHYHSLANDEAWALLCMKKGCTFNDICEGLCQWHTEEAASLRAASLLKDWLQAGLIADIIL